MVSQLADGLGLELGGHGVCMTTYGSTEGAAERCSGEGSVAERVVQWRGAVREGGAVERAVQWRGGRVVWRAVTPTSPAFTVAWKREA